MIKANSNNNREWCVLESKVKIVYKEFVDRTVNRGYQLGHETFCGVTLICYEAMIRNTNMFERKLAIIKKWNYTQFK